MIDFLSFLLDGTVMIWCFLFSFSLVFCLFVLIPYLLLNGDDNGR